MPNFFRRGPSPFYEPPTTPWQARANPAWPVPEIQNVVATCNLDCRLDLKLLAQQARNVEYNRTRFHALVMRIREPRTTTLVFASGKLVVTGARSTALARLAARKHARAIQKCGFQTRFRDFKVQNFVGSLSCGFHVRLEGVSHQYWQHATYEPEIFPGLVMRNLQLGVVCLVFATGKVVFTGAKEENLIYEAWLQLFPILLDYKFDSVVRAEPASRKAPARSRRRTDAE
ncbi:hypothetical protein VTK26DRAFT_6448 [Humicola hyalothermophila]